MAKAKITGDALEVAKLDLAELKTQWQRDFGQKLNDYVPETADIGTYNRLIKAVQDASQNNERIADLKSNISALGSAAVKLAKAVGILA